MIDTLTLTSKEFSKKNTKVTGLNKRVIYNDNGELIGEHSYLRADNYTLDINGNGMRVIMNPSKIINGHNFYPANNTTIQTACRLVSNDLKERGLILPFNEMTINRLDTVKNGFTKRNPREFNQLLDFFNAKRMKHREYPNGYLLGNKQRAVCFYDKLTELKDIHHFDTGELRLDNGINVIRAELRFQTTNAVIKNTQLSKVSELYNQDTIEHLNKCYKAVLKDTIFRDKDQHQQLQQLNFEQEVECITYFKATSPRNGLIKYIAYTGGVPSLIDRYGSLDNFKYALKEAGYSRKHINEFLNEIQMALKVVSGINMKYLDKHTVSQLYNELYTMLVA